MKKIVKILVIILLAFAVIQLIPIDRNNPPVEKNKDFFTQTQAPENVAVLFREACYDCHSNETRYPNYAYVAPISWSVKHHVNEGREHANYSEWGDYNENLKKSILENSIETINSKEMPIAGYAAWHPKANLTDADRKIMVNYLESVLKSNRY